MVRYGEGEPRPCHSSDIKANITYEITVGGHNSNMVENYAQTGHILGSCEVSESACSHWASACIFMNLL